MRHLAVKIGKAAERMSAGIASVKYRASDRVLQTKPFLLVLLPVRCYLVIAY